MSKKKLFSDEPLDTAFEDYGVWDKTTQKWSTGKWSGKPYVPCYHSHPPLPLGAGLVIYGGSCLTPVVKDAEVYVGLDHGFKPSARSWPWLTNPTTEVAFPITDMQAPVDAMAFVKLVEWLAQQIQLGRKCHAGCTGGHGRTGTLFAALARVMLGEEDAITYVRANYCKKAVESQAQIKFLGDVFGIKPAAPTKTSFTSTKKTGGTKALPSPSKSQPTGPVKFPAVQASFCLWGKDALPAPKKII